MRGAHADQSDSILCSRTMEYEYSQPILNECPHTTAFQLSIDERNYVRIKCNLICIFV